MINGFFTPFTHVTLIDEGHRQEVSVSSSKLKAYRGLKNLKCLINFETRRVGSRARVVVM
jgi:hypothetical protein